MRSWGLCGLAALVSACSHSVSQSSSVAPTEETQRLVPFTEAWITEGETREALSEGGSLPSRVVESLMEVVGKDSAGPGYKIRREDLDSAFDPISADDRIIYSCWRGEIIDFELSPEPQDENVVLTKDVRCTGSPEDGFARCGYTERIRYYDSDPTDHFQVDGSSVDEARSIVRLFREGSYSSSRSGNAGRYEGFRISRVERIASSHHTLGLYSCHCRGEILLADRVDEHGRKSLDLVDDGIVCVTPGS
jgi:hypothetical protein